VEKHPEVVRRIAAEGHAIGHHTYFHEEPKSVSSRQLMEEVGRTDALFKEILGERSRIFRPPWGKLTVGKLMRLWRAGQQVVLWNLDPKDSDRESAEEVRDLSAFRFITNFVRRKRIAGA